MGTHAFCRCRTTNCERACGCLLRGFCSSKCWCDKKLCPRKKPEHAVKRPFSSLSSPEENEPDGIDKGIAAAMVQEKGPMRGMPSASITNGPAIEQVCEQKKDDPYLQGIDLTLAPNAEIMIPGPKILCFIGSKGRRTIEKLQKTSGTRIVVVNDGRQKDYEKSLRIYGDPQKVNHAKKLVCDLIAFWKVFNEGHRFNLGFYSYEESGQRQTIEVTELQLDVGVIEKKCKKKMKKKIGNEIGALVHFLPNICKLTGTINQIEDAGPHIEKLIESKSVTELQLDVGVIGKNCKRRIKKEIENKIGTQVQFRKNLCTLKGAINQIDDARQLIESKLSQMRDSQIDQGRVNVHSIQPSNVPEQLSDNASESEPEVLIIPPPQKPKIPLIELD